MKRARMNGSADSCPVVTRIVLAIVTLCAAWPARAEDARPGLARPNIVLVNADDLGINDLSCYGRQDQPTPNLDRLAREGMRFTSAYCGQAICSASRAALMTGKAPARLHLTSYLPGRPDSPAQLLLQAPIEQQLPLAETTIAEHLRTAGYTSACIGKWHLGDRGFLPTDQGFDVYHPGKANTQPSDTEGGKGEYDLTTHAEEFLDAHRDRPFFLYVGHNCPHVPLAAKPELVAKHKDAFHPVYAAMIETLDDCVGRLMAKVETLGLAERTLFVFTSDNGGLDVLEGASAPATTNAPYRSGKGGCYEGGLRIPLIVRWTGRVPAGVVTEQLVINTDWLPTLSELVGAQPPADLDGRSFAGLLLEQQKLAARPLFWHFPHYTNQGGRPAGAVREGDWKLIEHYEDGRCELFDLAHDPGEQTDLSAKHAARVAELRGKLEAWRRSVAVQANAANPRFNGGYAERLYGHPPIDITRLPRTGTALELTERLQPWRTLMDDAIPRPRRKVPSQAEAGAGAVLLHARDAKIHGSKLRYEPEPHKDTLGFWTQPADYAEWEFDLPVAGEFEVQVLYGCGVGSGGSEVEVAVGGAALAMTVQETGHFQRFVPLSPGRVSLKAGRQTLTVRRKSKPGVAVMDLRRVTLRAAP